MEDNKTHVLDLLNQKIAESKAEIVYPEKGMVVHLGGLSYQVRFFSRRTGELRLSMLKTAKTPLEPTGGRAGAQNEG